MDSDDNFGLVIDEDQFEPEEPSSTQMDADDLNTSKNDVENQPHSNIPKRKTFESILEGMAKTRETRKKTKEWTKDGKESMTNGKESTKETREKSTHKAFKDKSKEDKESSTSKHKDKKKSLHRHKEHRDKVKDKDKDKDKRRSHFEKEKKVKKFEKRAHTFVSTSSSSSTNGDKRKLHGLRLTHLPATKILNITAPKHQFYNMRLYLCKDMLVSEMPDIYPAPQVLPDVKFDQLLYWPGVCINISLEHLQIMHEIKSNIERQIVIGGDALHNIDKTANPLETRYIQKVPSSKTHPMFSKEMFDLYISALGDAAKIKEVQVQASKLAELETAFDLVKKDVATVPFNELQTKMIHSRFLNKYKYVRYFDNCTDTPTKNRDAKAIMREILNPQVDFYVEKCIFTNDNCDMWNDHMDEFFKNVYIKQTKVLTDSLRERYKKCILLRCDLCYQPFEGPLCVVSLLIHMKEKHYFAKDWSCVNCEKSWSHSQLLSMKWKHDCIDNATSTAN